MHQPDITIQVNNPAPINSYGIPSPSSHKSSPRQQHSKRKSTLFQEDIEEDGDKYSNKIFTSAARAQITTYYIPAYLAVLFKKLEGFDLAKGMLIVSMTLILRIGVKYLNTVEKGCIDSIKMRINEDEAVEFNQSTSELKVSSDYFTFTQRKRMTLNFSPSLHGFPFDVQELGFKFELTSKTVIVSNETKVEVPDAVEPAQGSIDPNTVLTVDGISNAIKRVLVQTLPEIKSIRNEPRTCIFRFNLHSNRDPGVMVGFKNLPAKREKGGLRDMKIAYGLTEWDTPPERKAKDEVYFPVLKVLVFLYRTPEYVLLTSSLPLLLLDILLICTYVINLSEYSSRMVLVLILMLSLFLFLPTYRKEISIPALTSLDVAIFNTILLLIFLVVDSVAGALESGYLRLILPIISGALVFMMNLYLLVQYFLYLKKRHKFIEYRRVVSEKKDTSRAFEHRKWRAKGMILPDISVERKSAPKA